MFAHDKKPKSGVPEYHSGCQKAQNLQHFHLYQFERESSSTHLKHINFAYGYRKL